MSAGPAGGAADASVLRLFAEAAQQSPSRLALALPDGERTYQQLARDVGRLAAGLAALGVARGERAVVLVPMSLALYATLLGLFARGVVAVFVEPWMPPRRMASCAGSARPTLFVGAGRAHLLRLLDPGLRGVRRAVTTGRRVGPLPAPLTLAEVAASGRTGRPGVGSGGAPASGASDLVEAVPVSSDEPALVTFTTGSSGTPKGALRTHGFLRAQHEALARELPSVPGEAELTTFPVFALHNLASGVPTVLPPVDLRTVDALDAATAVTTVRRHGVRTVTASPPVVDRLAEHPEAARLGLRRIVTGGAPVADGQLRRWRAALPATEVQVVYGSSEAEPVARATLEERLAARSAARPASSGWYAGRPCGGIRLRVVRIAPGPIALGARGWGEWELPTGEIGELVVTGEHVGRHYFENQQAFAEGKIVEPDGTVWHRMGDTGYLDGDGAVWLAGRVHSTIWRRGEAVHAGLLEQAARGDDPRVRRVGAVGVPDSALGQRAVVVVEAEDGEATRGAVRERLARAGVPHDEVVVRRDPLPVDPRHRSKIDYPALRRQLAVGRGR
jgi:acyl-CoA synthetase (AMP-forming)/AMP-acid ligase II